MDINLSLDLHPNYPFKSKKSIQNTQAGRAKPWFSPANRLARHRAGQLGKPVSKWLGSPPVISHFHGHLEGEQPDA